MTKIKFDNNFFSFISSIAVDAGLKILTEFKKKKQAHYKNDGSPVTAADKIANELIVKSLLEYSSEIPILSEESSPDSSFLDSDVLWSVDPLDGTKEFLSNSPDFTVNIALIKNGDKIFLDPRSGKIELLVSEEILEKRRSEWENEFRYIIIIFLPI